MNLIINNALMSVILFLPHYLCLNFSNKITFNQLLCNFFVMVIELYTTCASKRGLLPITKRKLAIPYNNTNYRHQYCESTINKCSRRNY